MILNNKIFDQLLSKEGQDREFKRLQNAEVGEVLFVTSVYKNTDMEETLLYKAGVNYIIRVSGTRANFVKTK